MRSAVCALISILLVSAHARAQEQEAEPPPPAQPVPIYAPPPPVYVYGGLTPEALYIKGLHQRRVGVVLTSVGIGMAVLTGLLIYAAAQQPNDIDHVVVDLFAFATGFTALGLIIPGAILWGHGEDKMEQALQMGAQPPLSFVPSLRVSF